MRHCALMVGAALLLAAPRLATAQPEALAHEDVVTTMAAIDRAPSATADDWHAIGQAHFKARNYKQSIAAFQRAMQLGVVPGAALNVARAYALDGNRKQALRWVELAIASGDRSAQSIRDEPEFKSFRDDPSFRKLFKATLSSFEAPRAVTLVQRM